MAKPPVLALITLILTCTSILQVESTPSSNSSHPSPPSSQVPEWFEDCILHLVYMHHSKDVLVDRKPFTSECGSIYQSKKSPWCTPDDRVRRCWGVETQALAFPTTSFCYAEEAYPSNAPVPSEDFPPKASPWVLQSLRSLANKGHVKPFSMFEVRSRVYGSPYMIYIGRSPKSWSLQEKLLSFISTLHGSSVTEDLDLKKLPQPCQDYDCDLNSKQYWIQLFHVFRRSCWQWQHTDVTARRARLPRVFKYDEPKFPIPYRPPSLHL